jgi:hypothetical protein
LDADSSRNRRRGRPSPCLPVDRSRARGRSAWPNRRETVSASTPCAIKALAGERRSAGEHDLREPPPMDGAAPRVTQSIRRPKCECLAHRAREHAISQTRPADAELQPQGALSRQCSRKNAAVVFGSATVRRPYFVLGGFNRLSSAVWSRKRSTRTIRRGRSTSSHKRPQTSRAASRPSTRPSARSLAASRKGEHSW